MRNQRATLPFQRSPHLFLNPLRLTIGAYRSSAADLRIGDICFRQSRICSKSSSDDCTASGSAAEPREAINGPSSQTTHRDMQRTVWPAVLAAQHDLYPVVRYVITRTATLLQPTSTGRKYDHRE
jgi:hypothetical protein